MTNYYGAVAEFESAADIYHAAEKVTAEGYTRVDSHTPFPIHGMEKALRHPPSHLGWVCVICGLTGILLAQLMDTDETLFYGLLAAAPEVFLPIIYTPTVGDACEEFGHIHRRARGLFFRVRGGLYRHPCKSQHAER